MIIKQEIKQNFLLSNAVKFELFFIYLKKGLYTYKVATNMFQNRYYIIQKSLAWNTSFTVGKTVYVMFISYLLISMKNTLKAMEQPDNIIDKVIILSVNFCSCIIRYKVKNLWDQRKGTKEGLSTLRFYK